MSRNEREPGDPDKNLNFFVLLLAMLSHKSRNAEPKTDQYDFRASLFDKLFANFNAAASPLTTGEPRINPPARTTPDNDIEKSVRNSISKSVQETFHALDHRGYKLGAKTGNNIDCSGFVAVAVRNAMQDCQNTGFEDKGGNVTTVSTDARLTKDFVNHSEAQLQAMINRGVHIYREDDLQTIQPGYIFALDTGNKKFDAGRKIGIDHIVISFQGDDGNIYIAQSSSGKGVNRELASTWLARQHRNGTKLYAADLVEVTKISSGENYGMMVKSDTRTKLADNISDISASTAQQKPDQHLTIKVSHDA
jgi:cell wall-associated NlpC family hydrolase